MNRNYRYNRDTGEFEVIRDNSSPSRYYPGSPPPPYSDISSRGRLPSYSPGSNPDRFFRFTRSVRTPITISSSSGSSRIRSVTSMILDDSSELSLLSRGRRFMRRNFGTSSIGSGIPSNFSVNTNDLDRRSDFDERLEDLRLNYVREYNRRYGTIKNIKINGIEKNSIGIKYHIPNPDGFAGVVQKYGRNPPFEKRRWFVLGVLRDPPFNFSGWNVKIYNNNNSIINSFDYNYNDANDKRDKYVVIPDIRIPRRFKEYVNLKIQRDCNELSKSRIRTSDIYDKGRSSYR
ncbi:hypothetical protein BCR32DRAFT_282412 [Anaeromyces robustus]|uniref:Uncharacterized protein n=1 Tax=Anaeromyces robustus TaxID=1754192 RepID=A0A1Y1WYZ5_9FUNG|nr:hypothetical protein BCR32DRAFT_282412 [Anaeromyces robustus]|eukprot:ORX78314.1 hypothetical protein BCR32DRAFT_282412 [Anaeromyces robustus]